MSEDELLVIENRCKNATEAPWISFIEGKDHTSADSFIKSKAKDIYISNP